MKKRETPRVWSIIYYRRRFLKTYYNPYPVRFILMCADFDTIPKPANVMLTWARANIARTLLPN
jgi:hypothetical protein